MSTVSANKRRRPNLPPQPLNLVLNVKPNDPQPSAGFMPSCKLPLTADALMQDPAYTTFMDFSEMEIKPNADELPLLVCPNGYIFLETGSTNLKSATEFVIAIAEPVSRPEVIHEFQLTVFSLYAALSMGLTCDELLARLERYSKNVVSPILIAEVRRHGASFGRVKLVLRDRKYFIESSYRDELELLAANPVIAAARVQNSLTMRNVQKTEEESGGSKSAQTTVAVGSKNDFNVEVEDRVEEKLLEFLAQGEPQGPPGAENEEVEDVVPKVDKPDLVYSFQVEESRVGAIKEVALTVLGRPLLTEYDFWRDASNPPLQISLNQETRIRYYQERALRKMFSNGRARSGIIVLPCGAGKTLTGITAVTTIKKSAMVLTSSSVAVDQWKRSFLLFTTVDPSKVVALTADNKSDLPEDACVVCSTYTMMAYSGRRSEAAERIMQQIRRKDWGLLIFDEVQFAPAPAFRRITDLCRSHCKLGLTATLVREDDLINDLQWLIGPKLDEANWLELQKAGYLAKAKCSEVWCGMTIEYFRAYLNASPMKQRRLWVCNPNKLRVCEYLIRFHQARRDKIIVFSDNLFALKEVAYALKAPYISGEVSLQERMVIIHKFKTSPNCNVIFLSKVGDNAIDIPCATVVIQISFNFASRRQETQRLGRILRPKPNSNKPTTNSPDDIENYNAFFYSLVSKDTQEIAYADKRQQFIVDQGYAYKVIPMNVFNLDQHKLIFDDPVRQKTILQKILTSSDTGKGDLEEEEMPLNTID
ncbi:DNA repair helicase rad25 [Gregarina niphandrodes]|uniref:DNA 3'-5' helicase n=1 Tax=Gregarina niphandrodes TaxID=110365 RepID=A0A023B091_GRENI|nr:DNA repair helicase rad25 [Gregarina niphandrodes]EZG45054.1 DNA repair helicase rad25 [Gregarina niphandrodes]|eukprot:XP_011132585.1 DNA repair helicase rad25 [Gregarina niphandrodes]